MNVLSLFAGIGGLELGLERAGMTTVGQVEIDPFCQSVLARHWPGVPRHDDVRTAVEWWQSEPRPTVDVICGGFPCQDISNAGARKGITGPKSGLWGAMLATIRGVEPRYVIVENSSALAVRGIDVVLSDLHQLGFDAEWSVLTACRMGAPHTRERLFLLAHPNVDRPQTRGESRDGHDHQAPSGRKSQEHLHTVAQSHRRPSRNPWAREPAVDRVADGLTPELDRPRLKALGNAVVPAVSEYIGRRLMAVAA